MTIPDFKRNRDRGSGLAPLPGKQKPRRTPTVKTTPPAPPKPPPPRRSARVPRGRVPPPPLDLSGADPEERARITTENDELQRQVDANNASLAAMDNPPQPPKLGPTQFAHPLPGTRPTPNGLFGTERAYRNGIHQGWDLNSPEGTPVLAMRDGVVLPWRSSPNGGNILAIDFGDGFVGLYMHLMDNGYLVDEGMTVFAGQPVALVGSTGVSATEHLHFEIRLNGEAIDPGEIPFVELDAEGFGDFGVLTGFNQDQDFTKFTDVGQQIGQLGTELGRDLSQIDFAGLFGGAAVGSDETRSAYVRRLLGGGLDIMSQRVAGGSRLSLDDIKANRLSITAADRFDEVGFNSDITEILT